MSRPDLTIASASADLARGARASVELVEISLEQIERHNARTNAFTRVDAEGARSAARQADAERAQGRTRGSLHGIPISIKDIIDVAGQVTTAASRVLFDNVAAADAPVVTRLREAGAIIIGRTNLHEFALGTTSEASAFGAVRNPWDESRSAGGSSGGSAAAVATGMGLASIGTDTGGSIRIPAAACGIVGLKPSHGEVPTDGVIPLSHSLDHVGPLTTTVEDAAILWAVLAGRPVEPIAPLAISGVRLCHLDGYFSSPIEADVAEAFGHALDRLRAAGCRLTTASVPDTATIADVYINVVLPEAGAWHAKYLDTRGADYTPTVRERLQAGRAIPRDKYDAATRGRETLRPHVDALLADCDALVLPTLPIVAPPLGAVDLAIDASQARTPVRTAMLKHTQLFNLTGHPAISLPLPVSGLPVGLQLVGRRDETAALLAIAAACEAALAEK